MSTPDPRTEAAARKVVRILKINDGYGVRLGTRTYHFDSEASAIIEREWWVAFITDALTTEAARVRPACHKGDEMGRKDVLLRACYDLLKKCDEGIYMKNSLEQTVFYDEADCDGLCLMEDIALELGIEQP